MISTMNLTYVWYSFEVNYTVIEDYEIYEHVIEYLVIFSP